MEVFISRLKSYINKLDEKEREKYTINNDLYFNIMKVLKSEEIDVSTKFKYWVRRAYYLMNIGSTQSIYNKKTNLLLITQENMYDKINDCHISVGHSGRDKTWSEVDKFIRNFIPNL